MTTKLRLPGIVQKVQKKVRSRHIAIATSAGLGHMVKKGLATKGHSLRKSMAQAARIRRKQ